MIVTLNEMKKYLRIELDDDFEDDLLSSLLVTADEYVKEGTGFTFSNSIPERAKMVVKLLVSNWYENRELASNNGKNKVPYTVEALLGQLKLTYSEDEV